MIEQQHVGVYNATGPAEPLTLGALLDASRAASGSNATPVWADAAFLAEHTVAPWSDLPVWMPTDGEMAGFAAVNCTKAINAGLRFRPLADTVRDTLAWANPRPADYQMKAGLSCEREAEVLVAWHQLVQ